MYLHTVEVRCPVPNSSSLVKYVVNAPSVKCVLATDADGTLARAFFPNTEDLNTVFVYKKAFDSDTVRYQANIFAHELGHAIGLRHEFAPEEGDYVLFGPRNPNSVMSYKFPPTIQASDIVKVKLLYKLDEGSKIENCPVNRVEPDN